MRVRTTTVLLLVMILCLVAGRASAQTGTIRGTVLDGDRQPVADARILIEKTWNGRIVIEKAETGAPARPSRHEVRSNKRGEFMQVGLQPGTYRVTASKPGYQDAQLEQRVSLGDATVLPDITLRSGSSRAGAATPSAPAAEPGSSESREVSRGARDSSPAPTTARFVVDPDSIDKLAMNLRRRMDTTAGLQERFAKSQVAVMNFELLDVGTPSVAANVAEDLSTSMINSGFQVVERGQLDKALKELKTQDSGLVDPQTAKRLGQLVGCDTLVLGSISDRGQFVVINARLIDTATGRSLAAERVEMRKIPMTQ